MAVSHSKTQTSNFQSHPSGNEIKGVDEDDRQHPKFQDTEPFDDDFELDSQETQVLNHSDIDDPASTGMHEYEEEVVLDSEDEEVNGSRILKVKTSGFFNQKLGPHLLQQRGAGEKDERSPLPARLNYIDSQEPGEASQANALDFVEHFLSSNGDLGGSPRIHHRNATGVKSSPVSSTKGAQRLARMMTLGSQIEKAKTFEWVDPPEEHRWFDLFKNKIESSVVGNLKVRHVDDNNCISLCGENKERQIIQALHKETTESVEKIEDEIVNDSEEQLLDTVDMFDVGFNTQIAAEAMEALAFGDHPDTADVVSRGATENEGLLEHPYLGKSNFPYVGGINKNAKRGKRSTKTARRVVASFPNNSQSRELDPDSLALTKRRKVEKAVGGSNVRVLENDVSASISVGGSFLTKGQSQGNCTIDSSVSHQNMQSVSKSRLIGTEDRPKNAGESLNSVTKDGTITYRRKKRSLKAHPSEKDSGTKSGSNEPVDRANNVKKDDLITYSRKKKENCSKLCVLSEGDRNRQTNMLYVNLWSHPKGKRTLRNSRRSSVFYTPIVCGKDSSSNCDERPESSNDMKGPPQHYLNKDSDRNLALQSDKLDGTDPTSLHDVKSHVSVASSGSSKFVSHDHRRKPSNKNFPKSSSLLKELIGLGAPESTTDFTWKDLRRRRNMAYVQVLFSQHLDDDIIKQQKKVIARLGLSIASCPSDATHFIADQFARTRNMLEFIALGKPVVTHLWLESCGQANCLVSEKNYILRDAKKEKEIGFSMIVSLDCAKRCPLLKDKKVFITPNIKPDKEMMMSLVKALQGQPVEKFQISAAKDQKSFQNLLILSCEEDHVICLPFLENGAAVYCSELLLNGIVIQRLEYKRHQLFTTLVRRRCS